jgi:hypothetical protein
VDAPRRRHRRESLPRWRPRSAGPQGSSDRYFHGFEEERLREEACSRRIEERSAGLTSLEARRSELAEEISESGPTVPDPAELAELVGDIERALHDGELPERKAVMQAVVAEIRVRDRGQIQPVFRVPFWTTVWLGAPGPNRTKGTKAGDRVRAGRGDLHHRSVSATSTPMAEADGNRTRLRALARIPF